MVRHYCLFKTGFGPCGLLWSEKVCERLQLPEKSPMATRQRLTHDISDCEELDLRLAPGWVQGAVLSVQRLLSKGQADFSSIPIDMRPMPPFFRQVYEATRRIPPGQTLSYGALAQAVGSPGAARAVGQAMRRNPLPLIIPCHRVVAAGGKAGGFSAFGGVVTKQHLLALERVGSLEGQEDHAGALSQAVAYLKQQDPILGMLMDEVGACELQPKHRGSLFAALAEAIVYQQLHAKAAATIFGRFRGLYATPEFPMPSAVLQTSEETLRSVGLSRSKLLALRDLAERMERDLLPDMQQLLDMSDQDILDALTKVRGIGPWTVDMLLIFDLGRWDVLPATDYGVRKGFSLTFGRRELPSAEALQRSAERWRPFRSVASWYLWRAADRNKSAPA